MGSDVSDAGFDCCLQLLRTLDQGEALDISGLPDARLRAALEALLGNLSLRRTRQVGACASFGSHRPPAY